MKDNEGNSAAIHGAQLRTLEALFRHPTAHNLEWMDVVCADRENRGRASKRPNNKFTFDVGGEHYLMHKPHTKDLTSSEVVDLRHFLQRAGWSPEEPSQAAARPEPEPPTLMVVVDHHGAKIYRIDIGLRRRFEAEITPYDPHHFLHHLTHKEQSREQGQRAPEDPGFYKRIGDALAAGGSIVVVGHGTGKSNAAQHLTEYLRTHHHETYQRIVREIEADLSAVTTPQLLALAERASRRVVLIRAAAEGSGRGVCSWIRAPGLFVDRHGIGQRTIHDPRGRCHWMQDGVFRIQDVHDPGTARTERIGDHRAVAAPPDRFRAHDRRSRFSRQFHELE